MDLFGQLLWASGCERGVVVIPPWSCYGIDRAIDGAVIWMDAVEVADVTCSISLGHTTMGIIQIIKSEISETLSLEYVVGPKVCRELILQLRLRDVGLRDQILQILGLAAHTSESPKAGRAAIHIWLLDEVLASERVVIIRSCSSILIRGQCLMIHFAGLLPDSSLLCCCHQWISLKLRSPSSVGRCRQSASACCWMMSLVPVTQAPSVSTRPFILVHETLSCTDGISICHLHEVIRVEVHIG